MIVRQLRPEDHPAVEAIARATPGFSPPSPYVIWMLARTQGEFCCVAAGATTDSLAGYVLALATADPGEVFVWQLGLAGTTRADRLRTAEALIRHFHTVVRDRGVSVVRFTAVPGASYEKLGRLIADAFGSPPTVGPPVRLCEPTAEVEYLVRPS